MKRIILICLAALWLMPGVVMAHSKLENAVPAQDATVQASPGRIELTFNTDIEELSSLKLLNAAGEEIETDNKLVEGPTMSAAVAESLSGGIYSVKWTIIGADGHSVEGNYAFTVEETLVTDEPSPSPSVEDEPTVTDDAAETPASSPSPDPVAGADEASNNETGNTAAAGDEDTNYTPAIIIGAIIVAAALVLSLRRRKP
ncbi:copper resistance CopC family protein [Paenibacillus harenae]|uniref:copper resistance CopC family protein n=1 Tax=Paenibacillus harenae TaxID=306543 RepID=UPI0004031999|nr:copper resistance protein CopC [Paenibacillus harenae]